MTDTRGEEELRNWRLQAFCALALDAAGSMACLGEAIVQAEAALATSNPRQLLNAYRVLIGEPSNVATVADILQETSTANDAEAYVRALDVPLHRLRVVTQDLQRALGHVTVADSAGLGEDAAFATWRQQALHSPGTEALRWLALGKTFGFDALSDVHRRLCREQLQGVVAVHGESVSVGVDTWRAQLGAADGTLRAAVWDFIGSRARAASSTLGREAGSPAAGSGIGTFARPRRPSRRCAGWLPSAARQHRRHAPPRSARA